MADTKISALASKSAPAAADLVTIVDVSDTSMAGTGTNKQATLSALLSAGAVSVVTKTANYTLTASDNTVIGDCGSGGFTLTLPTAVGASGKTYTLKRADTTLNNTNTLTVATTSSQTIDGSTTLTLDLHNNWLVVRSDGSNWIIVDIGPGVRTRFRQTADATCTNTTTETSLVGTGSGSATLPANLLVPGRTIRITARGTLNNVAGGYTLTMKLKFGSTVVLTTAAVALNPASGSGRNWAVDALITCRSAGVSGSVIGQGHNVRTTNTSGSTTFEMVGSSTTIDTTSTQAIDMTATFSAASASNVMASTNFTIETLN